MLILNLMFSLDLPPSVIYVSVFSHIPILITCYKVCNFFLK